jgi:hypothetical protein
MRTTENYMTTIYRKYWPELDGKVPPKNKSLILRPIEKVIFGTIFVIIFAVLLYAVCTYAADLKPMEIPVEIIAH